MDKERFEALADAYGGDMDRWPQAQRQQARDYLRQHPGAADVLAQAFALDMLLNAAPAPALNPVFREKIIASAPRHRHPLTSVRAWASGAGLAAACALGMVLGASYSGSVLGDTAAEVLVQAPTAFDGGLYALPVEEIG